MTKFIKKTLNDTPIVDTVFAVVAKANEAKQQLGEDKVIDATIGALYDEDGKLVAYESVFKSYDAIDDRHKAQYAESFSGNPSFRKQVYDWVCQDQTLDLTHAVIATPGGSGAISTTLQCICDDEQTLLLPEIAWGSYKLMAEMFHLKTETYKLFEEDHFNLKDFKETCETIVKREHKLTVIINDPCHNPTGYSLTNDEWKEVITILNACGEYGSVVLLNDIAYIDYAYNFKESRKYLTNFNQMSDKVMVVVAFSSSKTLTSYGLRCGAALILAKKAEDVREVEIVLEKSARAVWSNIPNAAMENFVYVTTKGLDAYTKEKDYYVSLLKQRSDIFTKEAKEVCLQHYPYKEGFFVTIEVNDNEKKTRFHQLLMDHHIYTVQVYKGIRVALCSLNIKKTYGLAKRINDLYKTL